MATEYVHLEGMPEVKAMLSQFQGQKLQNKMRKAVRAGAKPFQVELKAEARAKNYPKKEVKILAAKVSTRGGASGRDITATQHPQGKLFHIFELGAKRHDIGHGGQFLAGRAGGRWRKKAFAARGPVSHRGVTARPILESSFQRGTPAARKAIADAIFAMTSPGATS